MGNRICQRLKTTVRLRSPLLSNMSKQLQTFGLPFIYQRQLNQFYFFTRSLDLWIRFRGLLSTGGGKITLR